jgi:hypothetical protein
VCLDIRDICIVVEAKLVCHASLSCEKVYRHHTMQISGILATNHRVGECDEQKIYP